MWFVRSLESYWMWRILLSVTCLLSWDKLTLPWTGCTLRLAGQFTGTLCANSSWCACILLRPSLSFCWWLHRQTGISRSASQDRRCFKFRVIKLQPGVKLCCFWKKNSFREIEQSYSTKFNTQCHVNAVGGEKTRIARGMRAACWTRVMRETRVVRGKARSRFFVDVAWFAF